MRSLLPLLLLLLMAPLGSAHSQVSSVENAVEKPMESVVKVPEYKSISEVPDGSYGFVNGVLYVYKSQFTFGAIPDLEFNIYASLILGEGLQAQNFANLDPSTVAAAKGRLASITSWMIQQAVNGAWGSDESGRLADAYFTSLAVRAIALAISSGSLPKERLGALSSSVSKLIALQDKGGGWSRIPEAGIFQYKQPTPLITAVALKALLAAKEAGLRVPDESITKALNFLAATARTGSMVYWEEQNFNTLYVTSEVADAIAEALYHNYSFDQSLLSGLMNYLDASVRKAYSQGSYDYMTASALSALAKFSSLGYLETDKLIKNYEPVIVSLANTIRPDGLFTDFPFIWLRYSYTYPYVAVFTNWLRVSSVSSTAYFVGGYGDYSPTVLVEGTSLNLKVSVVNKVSKPLSLAMTVSAQPPASLLDKGEARFSLGGGKDREFTFRIAAPEGLTSAQNVSVKIILREANSSKPIFAKSLPLRLVRNPILNLESKVAAPTSVQLRKPVNITLTFSNAGDLPINDLTFVEKLASGFELVTTFQGNGTALVTQTSSLGSYVMPQPLAPGSKITLVYQVMPVDSPPGPQTVSTTLISYTDARGERHNVSKEVKVTVLRPYLVISSNVSSLRMEWDEEKTLLLAVSNVGNEDATEVSVKLSGGEGLHLNLSMLPKEVMYRPNPDGSLSLRIERVASGNTVTLPIRVKATNFYPAHELGSFIALSYEYKDALGRSISGYSGSNIVRVTLVISKTFLYILSAIILVLALLIAIRIRNRARASSRRSILLTERRKRGRIPFES